VNKIIPEGFDTSLECVFYINEFYDRIIRWKFDKLLECVFYKYEFYNRIIPLGGFNTFFKCVFYIYEFYDRIIPLGFFNTLLKNCSKIEGLDFATNVITESGKILIRWNKIDILNHCGSVMVHKPEWLRAYQYTIFDPERYGNTIDQLTHNLGNKLKGIEKNGSIMCMSTRKTSSYAICDRILIYLIRKI
jgi:hypothetical protein